MSTCRTFLTFFRLTERRRSFGVLRAAQLWKGGIENVPRKDLPKAVLRPALQVFASETTAQASGSLAQPSDD
jgi:hypothetical protein